jgi:DNA-binding NarL/FixJ family response regulator
VRSYKSVETTLYQSGCGTAMTCTNRQFRLQSAIPLLDSLQVIAGYRRWENMKTALRRKVDTLIEEPVDLELLTPRQRDILRLVSIGHTNREIANMLQISVRTVEVHRFNLMRRLNVRNVAQLLRRALQLGLLSKSFGK